MELKSMHVRQATHADLPQLLALYQHLAPGDDCPSPEMASNILSRFLTYEGSGIFVGEIVSSLVASCTLIVVPNLTRGGRPYGLIENVVTHRDFRKRGLGRDILNNASAAAWEAGCYKIMLMTGSKQPETLKFYLNAGFEQSKTGFQKRRIPVRSE